MPTDDQLRIVREIMEDLNAHLFKRIGNVPAEWDGVELRQWVADVVSERFAVRMPAKRKREYNRVRAVNNL